MARIFISHSSQDQAQAVDLKAWLDSLGFDNTFLDFDKHSGIPPGADWERTLYREIERAQAVILILTKNWFDSKWCFAEFTQTRALGKAIFALIESPSGETAVVSSDIQHLNLIDNRTEGLNSLARELTRVALNAQGGFNWQPGRAPYPGLLAFEAADAAIFFGRDDDVMRAIERINARRVHGGAKLVAILGGSGSGKSSLLRAGILPRIARDKTNFLVVPPFRPGSDPVGNLLGALRTIDLSLKRTDLEAVDGPDKAMALIERLRLAAKAPQATLVIATDQAEEAFTAETAEIRENFFKLLSALLAGDQPALGIMTLRSDHLPDLQTAEKLAVNFEEFSLKPMPIERLGLIVEGPAKIAGLTVDEGLVTALMRDAKTQDALPLVAFVLRRLYDRHSGGGILTQAHYESMRSDKLSPLEVAVREAANEAMAREKPTKEALDALREAFVPALVRVNDEGGFLRQSAKLDLLVPLSHKMLRALADARLLVIDNGIVEVAHEALFRVWPLLAQWLEEEREFLVGKSRIEKSREDYAKLAEADRAKGLLSGILLERSKNWLIAHPQRFSGDESSFIRASVEEAERLEREQAEQREKLRQAELAHAKTEAERARQQAAATKKFLRFAVAAAVVLAALGAIAVYLFYDSRAAEQQAKTNYNLAIDQAASNVDLIVDNYQVGRITTNLLSALIARAQQTVNALHSDTSDAAAAKAKLLRAVGRANLVLSQIALAEQNGQLELAITARYVAQKPGDPDWMQLNERAQEEMGQTLYWKGDLADALKYLQSAVAAAQLLVAKYPDNKDYEQDLVEIYRFTGDSLRNQGNNDQALVQYNNWLSLANQLAAKQPDETVWLRDQVFAHQRMGDILMAGQKSADAAPEYQTYLDLATRGIAKESDNKEFSEAIVLGHQKLGDSYFQLGDLDNAMKEYQISLPLAAKLASADQSNFIWNEDLESAHQRVGEVLMRKSDFASALIEYRTYLKLASDELEKDESNGSALYDVANAHQKVGDALSGQKNYAGALADYKVTLSMAQTLIVRFPTEAGWKKLLATAYERTGLTLAAQGNNADALADFQNCAAISVPTKVWSPRNMTPADVTGFCRQQVAALSAGAPH